MKAPAGKRRKIRGVFEKVPGSGVWWVCYWDAQGRKRREKAGTKGMAIDLYRKRKTEALAGRKLPETLRRATVTFPEIARDALEYIKTHKRTYASDLYRMERLLGWWRERAADSITPQEIERRFNEAVAQDGWKPATVNRVKALLSLTYRLAIENGKVPSNPARLVRARQTDNTRVRWLSPDEETRLRMAIAEKWSRHLPELEIALHTGLRHSEQYGLTWENVDLGRRQLTIARSKNGHPRFVPLNSAAVRAFEMLRAGQANPAGPVFLQANGEPLTGPRKWFEPAVRRAKLLAFSWRCLRHTFASRLVMAGVDLRTLAELGGWRTLQMVMRYAHLAPAHQLEAVERLTQTLAVGTQVGPTSTTTDTRPQTPLAAEPAYVQ
jgi:site-specific recombinase XerD